MMMGRLGVVVAMVVMVGRPSAAATAAVELSLLSKYLVAARAGAAYRSKLSGYCCSGDALLGALAASLRAPAWNSALPMSLTGGPAVGRLLALVGRRLTFTFVATQCVASASGGLHY